MGIQPQRTTNKSFNFFKNIKFKKKKKILKIFKNEVLKTFE